MVETPAGSAETGSLTFQGPVIDWVADHRRHHAFADKDGAPHSPWLSCFGEWGPD